MKTAFLVFQIVLAILLTTLIFLQNNDGNDGRGNLMSNTNNEKRGWEKALFNFTIFILATFIISSMIQAAI